MHGTPALTAPSPAAFTDEGKVLKVGLAGGVSRGTEVISLEEISVTKVREARAGPHILPSPFGILPSSSCSRLLASLVSLASLPVAAHAITMEGKQEH